jgi:UDP-N-acetylglucosamine--N-acetylmuramyl-(pentapeptide) pyrophosphoryl-undecaprenol N-acetylglucosamine transferase
MYCTVEIQFPMQPPKLLVAASGTGGHLFPAIAVAQEMSDYQIEWLGVADRLETRLVPEKYRLHRVNVEGFQTRLGPKTLLILLRLIRAIWQTRRLLQTGKFQGVFTTGGYIAAPAIIAARSLGLPAVLHEANALPGKVTRLLSPWCSLLALGFSQTADYFPQVKTEYVGMPVRAGFYQPTPLELPIPEQGLLIVVVGGSQGALAVNRLVREVAQTWLSTGVWIVHLTGESDPEADSFRHPHYISLPFFENMAGLLQRADLAISRAGAGSLAELAATGTPAILIPYPFAAEDHQTFNARIFERGGAATILSQAGLDSQQLESTVLSLLQAPKTLKTMAQNAIALGVNDSTQRLVVHLRQILAVSD